MFNSLRANLIFIRNIKVYLTLHPDILISGCIKISKMYIVKNVSSYIFIM